MRRSGWAPTSYPRVYGRSQVAIAQGLSLTDAQTFGSIAAEHKLLDARWLSYEVDPRLQFDFPAMPDPAEPATAAMSRARRNAEEARPGGNPSSHRSAVAAFDHALTAAEAAAGVPRT